MRGGSSSLGDYANRKRFGLFYSQFTRRTILQHARKLQHFRYPATIVLLLGFNGELHLAGLFL